jgi:manganese transport protein
MGYSAAVDMTSWKQFRSHMAVARSERGKLNPLRYLGPGLLVAVGFVDPGNWASNLAAGAGFGYALLWVVTLSTIMLILLQHNAAHLGIVTGDCLAESATRHLPRWISRPVLGSAMLAVIATAFAEILGGAIALGMLFHLPLKVGACLTAIVVAGVLFMNTYQAIEKLIVGFVSLIGFGFVFELFLVKIHWLKVMVGCVAPATPPGSMFIVMSVLGAVVMPHNLFLHSEFIQTRQWHLQGEDVIERHLRFELFDTLFSMTVGWAINSAMVLLAAATFFRHAIRVDSLEQAEAMLRPILGPASAWVFALTLLLAALSSSVTAGMAGGSIFAGMFGRSYQIEEPTSRLGVLLSLVPALLLMLLVSNSFSALLLSQALLSLQLPITILLQINLTSSRKVMGKHANHGIGRLMLWAVTAVVIALNLMLFVHTLWGG